jgi:ABC-type branched-subunit amino acid transport system substrate-binding protein
LEEAGRHHQFAFFRQLEYSSDSPEDILSRVREANADAVLLWGDEATAVPLLHALRQNGIDVPVLSSSSLAIPEVARPGAEMGEIIVAAPCDLGQLPPEFQVFQKKFFARRGRQPGPVALYSYDVARLVIQTIQAHGLDRGRIREGLSKANYAGLAGVFQFDSLGATRLQPVLLTLSHGNWQRLSKPVETAVISTRVEKGIAGK